MLFQIDKRFSITLFRVTVIARTATRLSFWFLPGCDLSIYQEYYISIFSSSNFNPAFSGQLFKDRI